MQGRVYWITGMPGSGKTTIGTALYYALKEERENVVILDGDILKQIVGDTVGYERQDRLVRARKYSRLCKFLSEQGIWVIICTVAMFDEIRAWNRENINGYVEIFLDVPRDVLRRRDKKGLYSSSSGSAAWEQAGLGGTAEFPRDPDMAIRNDGSEGTLEDIVARVRAMSPRKEDDFGRDRDYWNRYYGSRRRELSGASAFAQTVAPEMEAGKHLLDIGCGNGRDSLFFLSEGLFVTGIDASDIAIRFLREKTRGDSRAYFVCDDFVKCHVLYQRQFDYIYSRFTLHAITEEQENELLGNIRDSLKKDGRLFIEARTIRDGLYGKGAQVAEHAYVYENHFRRFIDPDALLGKMTAMGYEILETEEGQGLSKVGDSDPTLLRVKARISEMQ